MPLTHPKNQSFSRLLSSIWGCSYDKARSLFLDLFSLLFDLRRCFSSFGEFGRDGVFTLLLLSETGEGRGVCVCFSNKNIMILCLEVRYNVAIVKLALAILLRKRQAQRLKPR